MRFTIERIRTFLLAAGVSIVVAIAVFLGMDKWRHSIAHPDIPKRLGIDIQQEASGVTYTQARGGHTLFKIHAVRVIELKNNHATLHDVLIDLYGRTGGTVDRIRGAEFDYDNKTGMATAAGQVQITLEQPASSGQSRGAKSAERAAGQTEIHVTTRGLVFNQQTGMVTTDERVQFSTSEATGSAMGASYDSGRDLLVLDREVEITAHPAPARGHAQAPVELHAQRAEFDRAAQVCTLTGATASSRGEEATAAEARIAVRADGSVATLDASGGFTLATAAGSHLAAPRATMEFNQRNQPSRGHLAGGVTLRSIGDGRAMSGNAGTMVLLFNDQGQLRHAHLEGQVEFASQDAGAAASAAGGITAAEITRTWHSPEADLDFRSPVPGKLEPTSIRGRGGVVLTSLTRRGNGPSLPSALAADALSGRLGPQAELQSLHGEGHARMEQTAADGAHQTATGDRLQARFAPGAPSGADEQPGNAGANGAAVLPAAAVHIERAVLEGQVTLSGQPAAKPGSAAPAPLFATAARAEYQGESQHLHLTGNPHVRQGGMNLAADRVDIEQETGDAFAHGNVKATWLEEASSPGGGRESAVAIGGHGPMHAIAEEAAFHQSSGEASFRGHARLWQQDSSISGPLIVLDQKKQTLAAHTTQVGEPVILVMMSEPGPQAAGRTGSAPGKEESRSAVPAVVRVRGGDLWYSSEDRKAILRAAPLPAVLAQSGIVQSASNEVELFLAPAGAAPGVGGSSVPAQVERMVASGHVELSSQGRHGYGEQLDYTGRTGQYVLTGTPSAPPRLTDPQRGSVTGTALIFNSRNDSVSIDGHGQETMTETTAPR